MKLDPNRDIWSKELPCWERGQEAGRTRPLNQDLLFQNLVDVHNVFDKYGIKHWISHGTMLGIYRDNQFIPWDDDCDIAADFSQRAHANLAAAELRTMGFFVPEADPTKPIGGDNAPYFDLHMIRNGEKVECWFFEKRGDEYIYDFPRCGRILAHANHYYDTLDECVFRGVTFKTPHDIEKYLVMMNGNGWKFPDPNKKYNHQR